MTDEYGHLWQVPDEATEPDGQIDQLQCAHCGVLSRAPESTQHCEVLPAPNDLVVLEMGLQDFPEEIRCPKCGAATVIVEYHPTVMVSFGDEVNPCQDWVQSGLLTPNTSQHLCIQCNRCRYGWPTKTRDA